MARLPKIGGDADKWATLLNEFLLVAHNPDGTARAVTAASLATGTVGLADLKTTNPPTEPIKNLRLANDGTNLVWKKDTVIDVKDFGAQGDGVTDDTAAIQAAIDSANMGGAIVFPRGVYMVTGLKLKVHGTQLVGGARYGTRLVRLSGTAPLVDMSGTGSVDNHLKYCALFNIMLSGNSLSGALVRSYYSDNAIFLNTSFIHCAGTAIDFVEVWDTRFDNCSWEDCGSATAPATLFRNSTPTGTFGFSNDNTNQIHFLGCRWEGFRNGAIRLDGEANGSVSKLNGIFIVACKMESSVLAGVALQIGGGCTVVYVNQLYMAMMAFDAGYNTPINAIEDSGTQIFMTNVYVQWGVQTGLANSFAHVIKGTPHMYHEVSTFYPTEDPAQAMFWIEPEAIEVMVACMWLNRGTDIKGLATTMLEGDPRTGLAIPLRTPASFRVTDHITGKDLIKVDANATRPALLFPNGVDAAGFSDIYASEKWRVVGSTGAARFAAGKFQIEPTKGYVGINTTPVTNIAMLIRAGADGDKGLAIVRPSSSATNRLMEFQDETYNIQGQAFDSNGRPLAVGTPARVTAGDQVSYANPGIQVRDIAGNIVAAVRPSPTAPGIIATLTFSRPYAATPLKIAIHDHSAVWANLYVSARSTTGFTISTRNALQGGAMLNFDYSVTA
jgi:hypothetical protein